MAAPDRHTDVDRMPKVSKDPIFQKTLRYPSAMRNGRLGVVHCLDSLHHELSRNARQGSTQHLSIKASDSDSITAIDAPHKASPPAHVMMGLVPKTLLKNNTNARSPPDVKGGRKGRQ
jgi:hypothetical protein